MTVPSRPLLLAFALAALVLPSTAGSSRSTAPNLIRNGSFEAPVVAKGGYELVSRGGSFTGWKVVGAAGNVAPISDAYIGRGIDFIAKAGKQWLDLTGLSNSATGVAQSVKTKPGARYRLSFAVGNVVDPGGIFGTTSTVNVLVNGHKLLAAVNRAGGHRQAWKTFTVTVKATSAATTIAFMNGDPRTDDDNGLDAVSLTGP